MGEEQKVLLLAKLK